jgi:hypothetical protein
MRLWFTLVALAILASMAPAQQIRITLPQKVALADCVVTGKVVALEENPVEVSVLPDSPKKLSYTIANLKIDEALVGAKDLTNIRIGFVPGKAGGVSPTRVPGAMAIRDLAVGQEGCYFLIKHIVGDFYTIAPMIAPLDKKAETYAKDLERVKTLTKILADPAAALKATEPKERLTAASMLILSYTAPRYNAKQIEIPADESKQILTILSEANWALDDADLFVAPRTLFSRLGLQPKDGFTAPVVTPGVDATPAMEKAAKEWLKANRDTYRIQKNVVGK